MKKPSKREHINLFFSAFLVLGFGVCAYFFSTISGNSLTNSLAGDLVYMLIFVLFGLILFYATRVGDGKQIKRFSPASLILICLPAIYVIVAYLFAFMPLHEQLAASGGNTAAVIAAVALGYGVPYTFLSGYEISDANEQSEQPEDESAEGDEENVDYSDIKTLDIGSDDEDGAEQDDMEQAGSDDGAEQDEAELPNGDEASDDNAQAEENATEEEKISDDTEKTIQSILEESADK